MGGHTAYRRAAALVVTLAAATSLAACGGSATVTEDATGTSIAPLPRPGAVTTTDQTGDKTSADGHGDKAKEPGSDDNKDGTETPSIPSAARVRKTTVRNPTDQGAKEITAIPSFAPERTPADNSYLAAVSNQGITIDGVEEQLIGTAVEVCRDPVDSHVTVTAVAGQLVAQQRTTLTPEETARIVGDAARQAYCPPQ